MATLAASIASQIAAIDAQMSAISPTSVGANGVNETNPDWIALSKRRMALEVYLGRVNGTAPMIVRGIVKGL